MICPKFKFEIIVVEFFLIEITKNPYSDFVSKVS